VLELLAAICLVSGGHDVIIQAFDHFKEVDLQCCALRYVMLCCFRVSWILLQLHSCAVFGNLLQN